MHPCVLAALRGGGGLHNVREEDLYPANRDPSSCAAVQPGEIKGRQLTVLALLLNPDSLSYNNLAHFQVIF